MTFGAIRHVDLQKSRFLVRNLREKEERAYGSQFVMELGCHRQASLVLGHLLRSVSHPSITEAQTTVVS